MTRPHKDVGGGALMLALGIGVAAQARFYEIGTLRRMGPGYFPLVLGVLLAVVGALILLGGLRAAAPAAPAAPFAWRGPLAICAGLAGFAVLGRWGGLLPASFVSVFVAALGDKRNSLAAAAALAAAMTLAALVVFHFVLRIQLPLLRWG